MPWSSALTFSAGYPSNHGILKASCAIPFLSTLLAPKKAQSPLLSWLKTSGQGRFCLDSIRQPPLPPPATAVATATTTTTTTIAARPASLMSAARL